MRSKIHFWKHPHNLTNASLLLGARCNEAQVDLTFVVDTSSGIGVGQNWDVIRQFMVDIVDNLPISPANARVGLISISNVATNRFYLDTYTTREQVSKCLIGIRTNAKKMLPFCKKKFCGH